jgi:hypothetical protein
MPYIAMCRMGYNVLLYWYSIPHGYKLAKSSFLSLCHSSALSKGKRYMAVKQQSAIAKLNHNSKTVYWVKVEKAYKKTNVLKLGVLDSVAVVGTDRLPENEYKGDYLVWSLPSFSILNGT